MKLIFLDIDGVLNNELFFKSRKEKAIKNESRIDFEVSMFDPRCVDLLNHIVDKTNAYVVISSTWRKGKDVKELENLFDKVGFKGTIIGKTPWLTYAGENGTVPRGCEIKHWLDNHPDKDKYLDARYVILDDDSDMLYWQRENYFRVDGYCGLTPNLCYRVINYLNKE